MYKTFYKLRDKPFALLPDTDFLYLGTTHRTAYSLLEYGLLSEAPFMVLTGDPGMGKTSLLQKVIAENRANFSIGFVTNARYDVDHLLPWILLAFGLSQRKLDPVEAHHTFSEFLSREAKQNRRVVLIVDEAQTLGVNLLEELRLLSNMNQEKTLYLQIILSGQPDLHQLLQRNEMTQFAQRIVVDYHLQPFTKEEVTNYIHHRLYVAGARISLFTDQALSAHRLSKGNPRLINQICEMALTYGFAQQASHITAKLLAQASLDRQKNKILPIADCEDLAAVVTAPQEEDETADLILDQPFLSGQHLRRPQATTVSAETLYQTGLSLKRSGDFKEAIEHFEQAAAYPSSHLKSFGQIGLCYQAIEQPHHAVLAFRKALSDQSAPLQENLNVRFLLAITLEQLGERPEALDQYQKIYRIDRAFKDVGVRILNLEKYFPARSMRHPLKPSMTRRVLKRILQLLL